ncbi:MAG: FtsW/RodA/SpoVE family cell cycle protein [Alphaproteobacteria bacterium]
MEHWRLNNYTVFDRTQLSFLKKWWIDIDKVNFSIILILMIFGLMMTATSSPAIAKRIDVDKFYFLKKQLFFSIFALGILISISFMNSNHIKLFALIGMATFIFLLMVVLIFGSKAKGSTRWLSLGLITIQPSEFAKTFFVIFNGYCLHRFVNHKFQYKYGIPILTISIICLLLYFQPDFGMIISFILIFSVQLFLFGIPWILIFILGVGGVILGIGAYLSLPHVEDRINRFLDTNQKNYQAERAIDAFANGSYLGKGPGNGMVKKHIPDVHTDFIFSAIGEEYGIVSCVVVLLIFAYLVARIVRRAIDENDLFIYLSLCGLMTQFVIQVFVNTSVSLSLIPTKGMTLPFISYGGSSLIATSICFGLILALTKRKYRRENF